MSAERSAGTLVALAGTSNAIAASVTNPIDVIKTRMQMHGEGVRSKSGGGGVLHTARAILSAEGAGGLYRGLSASLCREMSYSGIRMGMYEPTRRSLAGWLGVDPAHTPLFLKVLAGAITGCSGSALANPLDLVKVRMQAIEAGRPAYSSVPAALSAIYREGGVPGLWRGTVPTVQRATLLTASQVPAYDHVKHLMLDGGHMREGYLCHFVCSMIAGVVAAAVTSPVDLVKSRMMVQPLDPATGRGTLYSTTTACFRTVVRTEGGLALFKGFHSQWLRIGPHTTISLMVFEQLRARLGMAYL